MTESFLFESQILAIGGDDPRRTREIMLAMYDYLINKPHNTRRVYRTGIRKFLDLVYWKDLKTVTLADAAHYKQILVNQNYSKSTVTTRLAAITGFFDFLVRRRMVDRNPFDLLERKDVLPDDPEPPVPAEWKDLQKMLDKLPTDPIGMRDRAVLIFLAYTGRRRTEVAGLRIRDLSTNSVPRTFRVTTKDGPQEFDLPPEAYAAMRVHWISSQRLERLTPDSAVFGEAKICPISAHMDRERLLNDMIVWHVVRRARKRAKLDPAKTRIRGLRNMAPPDGQKIGARMHDSQDFLAQAWPNSASRYLGQLRAQPAELRDAIKKIRRAAVETAGPILRYIH